MLVTLPGVWLLYQLVRYGVSAWEPAVLVPVGGHLILLASCFLPRRARFDQTAPAMITLTALGTRLVQRHDRLVLLRRLVVLELMASFGYPILAGLLGAEPIRWGPWFTLSLAMLVVLRPLEMMTRAERREGRRLVHRTLEPPPPL
jgi:hypothetical protein